MQAVGERSDSVPRVRILRSVELFAGAGGLALGLQTAGFHPKLVVERDPRAIETLKANGGDGGSLGTKWPLLKDDVEHVDFHEFGDVDLVSAGPPCQPFSIGGLRLGRHDDRDAFPEAIRAIRETKPKVFLVENVRGLTFPAAAAYLEYTLAQLRVPSVVTTGDEEDHRKRIQAIPEKDHEYRVEWKLLNSADYGIGQQRVRLMIVGVRSGLPEWHWPEPTHSRAALLAALAGEDYWREHELPDSVRDKSRAAMHKLRTTLRSESTAGLRWVTTRDVLAELGPPGSIPDDAHHRVVAGARLYKKHQGSVLDWPAKTVKAGVHGTPGGEHIVRLDDGTHRYLTVRECAALQGFPVSYKLPAIRSVALRQIGNAVPVGLGEVVGRQIASLLRGDGEDADCG